jgi:RHS repeat-associated protein
MDGRSRIARREVFGASWTGSQTDAVKYVMEDHLGNASFTLTATGGAYQREEYFPFGETSFGSYGKKRYRFCGKERDEESGLYYYGARYYMPWQCRFVSVDPLAAKFVMLTPYQYASNTPIFAWDLDGLEAVPYYYHIPSHPNFDLETPTKNKSLKKGQWYDSYGKMGFDDAARFNTLNLRSDVYKPIAEVNLYYQWAVKMANKYFPDIKFFHAAESVTDIMHVDGLYRGSKSTNRFLSKDGIEIMEEINMGLLARNMPTIRDFMVQGSSDIVAGNGAVWDYNYVDYEQDFVDAYLAEKKMSKEDREVTNKMFEIARLEGMPIPFYTDPATDPFPPDNVLQGAFELVGRQTLDFENPIHRRAIGRASVYSFHLKREVFVNSQEYNQVSTMFENEYGKEETENFKAAIK